MNKVLLVGRIANDVRVFSTPSGITYARTSIAVARRTNSTEPVTDFIPVVAWRATADYLGKVLSKGSLVSIEGWFTTGTFRSQNGETVRTYEVTIENLQSLETRQQREAREINSQNRANSYSNQTSNQSKFTGATHQQANNFASNSLNERDTQYTEQNQNIPVNNKFVIDDFDGVEDNLD
ncbi:single-stranded DNA-binding protein [Mycoplasmopsis mucosicanis]|uniref:Single-stranded DNA-binding protein n=1 Tax=Mycoplasmopsis mucosicanis TaxID=458208 RepID=A0A507SSE7_9BACT|nr:single-stranded DNA-binding protein [Mycoplasmopsis mucosicanis]TQC54171.1 single-stranded DNA-binding protein [Mycoplasmopsis mucosicanis]